MQTGKQGEEEIVEIFEDTLPLIHSILTSFYRLIEEEAEAFEQTLRVWFQRVAKRVGANHADLRAQLLFVAFKYARALQIAKFRGSGTKKEAFEKALAQPPEDLVLEILTRVAARGTFV